MKKEMLTEFSEARRLSGLTVEQCAARVGVSKRAWMYWESGDRKPSDASVLMVRTFVWPTGRKFNAKKGIWI